MFWSFLLPENSGCYCKIIKCWEIIPDGENILRHEMSRALSLSKCFLSRTKPSLQDKREGRHSPSKLEALNVDAVWFPESHPTQSCHALPRPFLWHAGPPLLRASLPLWTACIPPSLLLAKAKVLVGRRADPCLPRRKCYPAVLAAHNNILFCSSPREKVSSAWQGDGLLLKPCT